MTLYETFARNPLLAAALALAASVVVPNTANAQYKNTEFGIDAG